MNELLIAIAMMCQATGASLRHSEDKIKYQKKCVAKYISCTTALDGSAFRARKCIASRIKR